MKPTLALILIISACALMSVATPTYAQDSGLSITDKYADIQEQGLIFAGICESATAECACRDTGDCTLNDILQLLVNLSVFIFGISGSVMLLVLIYGGFKWILASGRSEWIEDGKKAIIGAIIGLVIILGAYTAINVIVSVLKTGEIPTTDIEDTLGDGAADIIETP